MGKNEGFVNALADRIENLGLWLVANADDLAKGEPGMTSFEIRSSIVVDGRFFPDDSQFVEITRGNYHKVHVLDKSKK